MLRASWLLLPAFLCISGCTGSPAKPPSAAVSSEKPKIESELAFATISKIAAAKLHIQTQEAKLEDVHEYLAMTGWIMAKPGHEVTLTAPAAGFVQFRNNQRVPIAGETVKAGQELLQLDPVLSPVEQIQVAALKRSIESDLVKAETTLKTAESEFQRIRDLFKQNIRSKQEFEQAQKARDHALEEIAAGKDKLTYFQTRSITLKAPQAGQVLILHAGPGQYVPVSAPLLTIIDLQPVWIRVPVPEYDLPIIDPQQNVKITWKNPNQDRGAKPAFLSAIPADNEKPVFFTARPAGRVAQVDPVKHTADLWYELEPAKEAGRFVKDQMMTVQVPIGKKVKATVVPYSAIVFDAYGHAWVYLDHGEDNTGKLKFERRRIELVTSVDGGLIVRPALADGERVVTHGAAALFSREFHKPPVHIPAEGD